MKVLVTGSGGLIGSEVVLHFLRQNYHVVGIDNNSRQIFFGPEGRVSTVVSDLKKFARYRHKHVDIRNRDSVTEIFRDERPDAVIHCAAQPSHDYASKIPHLDFHVNAVGTLNLLEATRECVSGSPFVFVSTNKVYGDHPNRESITEGHDRFDFHISSRWFNGVDETCPIDQCTHSLMGASKLAADVMVQEYGRYFGMKSACFRGGCLTGPNHAGVELHGFMSYIVKCAITSRKYTIFGHKGKQVRDQIHSHDVASAFSTFVHSPKSGGQVYNIGGGKENSASIIEVIDMLEGRLHKRLDHDLVDNPRVGDHICYYTDMSKFRRDYPSWRQEYTISDIVDDVVLSHQRSS